MAAFGIEARRVVDFGLSSVSQRTYRGLAFHKCVQLTMYGGLVLYAEDCNTIRLQFLRQACILCRWCYQAEGQSPNLSEWHRSRLQSEVH